MNLIDFTEGKNRLVVQRNLSIDGHDYQEDILVFHADSRVFDIMDNTNSDLMMPQEMEMKSTRRSVAFTLEKIFKKTFETMEVFD